MKVVVGPGKDRASLSSPLCFQALLSSQGLRDVALLPGVRLGQSIHLFLMSFAQTKNQPAGYVTFTAEKFTLGLGYIQEPINDLKFSNIYCKLTYNHYFDFLILPLPFQ